VTSEQRDHLIKHGAWKAHQTHCNCDMDNPLTPGDISRATAFMDAVEDAIRRDERNRITAWLRECAARPELNITQIGRHAIEVIADELDRRPIGD